jgi:hypothetical protein
MTLAVPFNQLWITGSLQSSIGMLITRDDRLEWLGTLGIGEVLTATYRLTTPRTLSSLWLYGSATAATDQAVWHTGSYWQAVPFRAYLPVVRKLK